MLEILNTSLQYPLNEKSDEYSPVVYFESKLVKYHHLNLVFHVHVSVPRFEIKTLSGNIVDKNCLCTIHTISDEKINEKYLSNIILISHHHCIC
jgi:hypothetical protein